MRRCIILILLGVLTIIIMMMMKMNIICMRIQIMIRIFRKWKSKSQLYLFELHLGNSSFIAYLLCGFISIFFHSKLHNLSVFKTYPKSKSFVIFNFNPTPVAKKIDKPPIKPRSKRCAKSNAKSKAKHLSRHWSKQQKYDHTQEKYLDFTFGLLDLLPLHTHYKTKHLLDKLLE